VFQNAPYEVAAMELRSCDAVQTHLVEGQRQHRWSYCRSADRYASLSRDCDLPNSHEPLSRQDGNSWAWTVRSTKQPALRAHMQSVRDLSLRLALWKIDACQRFHCLT